MLVHYKLGSFQHARRRRFSFFQESRPRICGTRPIRRICFGVCLMPDKRWCRYLTSRAQMGPGPYSNGDPDPIGPIGSQAHMDPNCAQMDPGPRPNWAKMCPRPRLCPGPGPSTIMLFDSSNACLACGSSDPQGHNPEVGFWADDHNSDNRFVQK